MRILICAGGTGGGIYPALTAVQALQAQGVRREAICWVGTAGEMEAQLVPRAGLRLDGVSGAPGTSPARGTASAGASFRDAMVKALGGVSDAQVEASRLQREFSLENPAVSLESVMIASEKAKLGFTAAVSVRNRLVQAYTEIMNMQV